MRTIDADALKELFPDNGEGSWTYNATVKAYIDAQPTIQPDTTTHDSIPVETGKNDGDRTSGDCISRAQVIDALKTDMASLDHIIKGMSAYDVRLDAYVSQRNQVDCDIDTISNLPPAQPEHKTGRWILDRSGAYCCDNCMEPCAGYVMMKPRDKFCKMCGSRNEVME